VEKRKENGDRGPISTSLLTELEFDRKAMEVCKEENTWSLL